MNFRVRHYLGAGSWKDWDLIIHEYGHLVAGDAGFFGLTGIYWSHTLGVNSRFKNPNADFYDSMQLGFNEGWANFYSVVAQEIQGVSSPKVGNAKDGKYHAHSAEATVGSGEDEELAVMAILWDLYDTANDGESVAMGMNALFALLSTGPLTLDELWDKLLANASNLSTKLELGRIFEAHNVSPKLIGAVSSGSIAAPMRSVIVKKGDPPPTFSWDIPVGTNPSGTVGPQILNRFGIKIFDSADTLIFDSGHLTEGTGSGTMQISGNRVTFTPTPSDWSTNVTSRAAAVNATFRWVAYGGFFGDETLQSNILTGNYWSSTGEIIVQP